MYLGGSMGGEFLSARSNVFGGVEVDPDGLPQDPKGFERVLSASLQAWRAEGYQIVWLEIPVDRASFIPIAVAQGFRFHHCQWFCRGRSRRRRQRGKDIHGMDTRCG